MNDPELEAIKKRLDRICRIEAGLCPVCGAPNHDQEYVMCENCRITDRERMRRETFRTRKRSAWFEAVHSWMIEGGKSMPRPAVVIEYDI